MKVFEHLSQPPSDPKLGINGEPQGKVVRITDRANLHAAMSHIGIQKPRPVLVIVGGASNLSSADYARIQSLFFESLAPLADELDMVVIDGGTDTGVMQLMGQARAAIKGRFPLVGVAPFEKVLVPGNTNPQAKPLEPNHTHFILVPGSKWGDESSWMSDIASLLSGKEPSVTLLMNGGNASIVDVKESINHNRPVLVVAGTGRLADEIATAIRSPDIEVRAELSPFVRTNRCKDFLTLFDLGKPKFQLKESLKLHFKSPNQWSLHSVFESASAMMLLNRQR